MPKKLCQKRKYTR